MISEHLKYEGPETIYCDLPNPFHLFAQNCCKYLELLFF
jgi:hypothetical protein